MRNQPSAFHDKQDAGPFSVWLNLFERTLKSGEAVPVPCGDCTVCCRSSLFIHIKPEETETIKHIPDNLLFPAPGLPEGFRVLGYDQNGRCPMLDDGRCSIYPFRPQTCRSFDCRIFPATGIPFSGNEADLLNRQSSRWEFRYPAPIDKQSHKAVRTAAAFIGEHSARFPSGFIPSDRVQRALMAIHVHGIFIPEERQKRVDTVKAILEIVRGLRQFE